MFRHTLAWLGMVLATAGVLAEETPSAKPGAPSPGKPEILPLPRTIEKGKPEPKVDPLSRAIAQLQQERKALKADRDAAWRDIEATDQGDETELAKLRLRLKELVARLAIQKSQTRSDEPVQHPLPIGPDKPPGLEPKEPATSAAMGKNVANSGTVPTSPPTKIEPKPEPITAVDPAALAQAFFRSKDFAGALRAYRLIDQGQLKVDDRLTIQYLMATCLRRTGKVGEATALYKKVADSRRNEIMADCARWQLTSIRWQQDLQARLKEIRAQRKALEVKK